MKISNGIIKEPHFILLYGPDGIGKTTFVAEAPKPIIVGPEGGSNRINTSRATGINTYEDVVNAIKWLRNEKHEFQTVGLDSLDWIEPLLWKDICEKGKVDTIEDYNGGFGKGYTEAVNLWSKFIAQVKDLRDNRQMNVIAIAHSHTKAANDPMHATPYDRHTLKLNDKAAAKWREAVDAVLFANFEDTIFKLNKNDKKAKASGAGVRKLYTVRRAAFDAKNRLGLPEELPLSYEAFATAADIANPDSLEQVVSDLVQLHAEISLTDKGAAERMKAAQVKAGTDVTKLISIRNHARVLAQ